MATYGQTVTVTQIDQIVSRSGTVGTSTATLVVPTNAEAEIFVRCAASDSTGIITATGELRAPISGVVFFASIINGSVSDSINLVVGPGTYTLQAILSGTGTASASCRIVGSLRTYS